MSDVCSTYVYGRDFLDRMRCSIFNLGILLFSSTSNSRIFCFPTGHQVVLSGTCIIQRPVEPGALSLIDWCVVCRCPQGHGEDPGQSAAAGGREEGGRLLCAAPGLPEQPPGRRRDPRQGGELETGAQGL